MIVQALNLCLITHPNKYSLDQYIELVKQAISGGVTSVQLRDKTSSSAAIHKLAYALKALLSPLEIPLIINDNVGLAIEVDAQGVHLGQSDVSPLEARTLLGPNKIIGYSIESYDNLKQANQLNCIDYVAASSVFSSKTKLDCKTVWGLGGLKEISRHSKHPVIAIGGINQSNARQVITHGASGIAVISAIHDHPNPYEAAKQLIHQIQQGQLYVQDPL